MNYQLKSKQAFFKQRWFIITVAIIFLVAILLLVLEKTHVIDIFSTPTPDSQVDQSNPTNAINDSSSTKESSNISDQIKESESNPDIQTNLQDIQVTLTQVVQDETSRNLVVRSLINGTMSGNCKLELIRDGVTLLIKEAGVLQQNNIATCAGYDISPAEFPSLGEFTVKLTVTANSSSASDSYVIILDK